MQQEISALNVNLTCDAKCEGCEKYFDCVSPKKSGMRKRGRMDKVRTNLAGVKHKILSVGGKGGVGKTLVAANLAVALSMMGRKVSVLDLVLDAPCIPRMLGVEGAGMEISDKGLKPTEALLGIQVISMGLILQSDEVLTWFHDMKRGATEELLADVHYGERDYLIIDVPAGTSSDTVNVIQYIPDMDGATVVTVPSVVSQAVAHKAILLLKKAAVPIFGIFENMGTFICPDCGEKVDLFQTGGGKRLAESTGIPYLSSIPIDSKVAQCADDGVPVVYKYPDSEAAKIFAAAAEKIERLIWKGDK